MKLLGIAMALLWLLPAPAAAQGVGTVTMLDGPLRVIRGTAVLQGSEGIRLRQGDLIETSDGGFAQLEFSGGAIVALGPSSRMSLLRSGIERKSGDEAVGAELVLLSGWLKGQSGAAAGAYRYESPLLAATTANGTVVFHHGEGECDVFVESGAAAISEVSSGGSGGKPTAAKANQFFSRHAGKAVASFSRPSAGFVEAVPRPFKDTLPSRLAHFTGKPPEPKVQHQVSYSEIQGWLTMPPAWRRGFVERFEPRLKDPEFRKQLETHVGEYPEWEPVLHPEKQAPESPPAAPNSQSPHARV